MNFSFKGMFDPANERILPLLSYETRAKGEGIAVFQESTFQNGLNFDFFKLIQLEKILTSLADIHFQTQVNL